MTIPDALNTPLKNDELNTEKISSQVISMCYDSGTFPTTLCDNPEFFSSLSYFTCPKAVSLGDNNKLIPAIAEGVMDSVIDGQFRMQEHAILTESTPVALKSTANHIKSTSAR